MFRVFVFSLVLVPLFALADLLPCDQQQNVCMAACEVSNIGNEQGLSSCKAKCLGARVSCTLKAGADKLKESAAASEGTGDQWKRNVEAFWEGLKSNQ